MARAMGLNTIATYVFWNVHEPQKGRFRFDGDADLAAFVRIAHEEGLYVLLRPGPYVCAEWEFGGLPYWLLNEKTGGHELRVRTSDPNFLRYAERYLREVGRRLAPMQADRGGNVLMVQVENEYGSFGSDRAYMAAIRDAIRRAGFTVPLFTADGPSQTAAGHIDGALPGVNGAGGPQLIRVVDSFHRGGPYLAPEIYPGWLDHWGEPFVHSNPNSAPATLDWFLQHDCSISLYMFHGGTNFGFMNGANYGSGYLPSITSYDYSAPLDEAGRPTPQYANMRNTIRARMPGQSLPDIPAANPVISIPTITLQAAGSVLDRLPPPIHSERPISMEAAGQDYGFILYRTHVAGPADDRLTVRNVRDFAVVMIDGAPAGTLDRRRNQRSLQVSIPAAGATLDILLENCGRINYGPLLQDNHKGITESVTLGDTELKGWRIYPLPMTDPRPPPAAAVSGGSARRSRPDGRGQWAADMWPAAGGQGRSVGTAFNATELPLDRRTAIGRAIGLAHDGNAPLHGMDFGAAAGDRETGGGRNSEPNTDRASATARTSGKKPRLSSEGEAPAGASRKAAPHFLVGSFQVDRIGDTFLDMRGWGKGAVWVNGHALGRYWSIGPQQTLYLPGPWLRRGRNRIVVFEELISCPPTIRGIAEPILDRLTPATESGLAARPKMSRQPAPTQADLAAEGAFTSADSAQIVRFAPRRARFVCLESTSAFDGSAFASCAELQVLDGAGRPLKSGRWRILYADSEESAQEDGSADNMIDGDESSIWHTAWSERVTGHPHRVVIDLGEPVVCSGFRCVPRSGDKPGKIKGYRFYAALEPFGAR